MGRKSVEYIENYEGGSPMFLWVSFSGPHYPFDPPVEYIEKVDMRKDAGRIYREGELDDASRIHHQSFHGPRGIDGCRAAPDGACKNYSEQYWRALRKNYYANVCQIDAQIGRILKAVDEKFGDNALIIFTADHGEMLGNHGLWGENNCGYEEVWSIPLLVRYPGECGGRVLAEKVMNLDILATCVKAAGGNQKGDGVDFKDNIAQGGYRYVFGEGEGYMAVSDGTVKLIHVQQGESEFNELIDLAEDRHEFENRIKVPAYASKAAELRGEVVKLLMRKTLP